MKVKELIALLQTQNPESELMAPKVGYICPMPIKTFDVIQENRIIGTRYNTTHEDLNELIKIAEMSLKKSKAKKDGNVYQKLVQDVEKLKNTVLPPVSVISYTTFF